MVKFLVEHSANVNVCDNDGWTPLHAACSNGFIDIARSVSSFRLRELHCKMLILTVMQVTIAKCFLYIMCFVWWSTICECNCIGSVSVAEMIIGLDVRCPCLNRNMVVCWSAPSGYCFLDCLGANSFCSTGHRCVIGFTNLHKKHYYIRKIVLCIMHCVMHKIIFLI